MDWISVKDHMPTDAEWNRGVVTYTSGGKKRVSGFSPRAFAARGSGFWFDVTHWMPLPAPPETK